MAECWNGAQEYMVADQPHSQSPARPPECDISGVTVVSSDALPMGVCESSNATLVTALLFGPAQHFVCTELAPPLLQIPSCPHSSQLTHHTHKHACREAPRHPGRAWHNSKPAAGLL